MENISATIPINIFVNPDVMENIYIGANCSPKEIVIYTALFKEFRDVFAWSYEEMPGIDPSIVEHEIWIYPDAKPIQQKLRPVNPRKVAAMNAKVEKMLKDGFIYPIALMKWVSNPVPIDKKQGTIRVCTNFRDLNKSCPKDNYPMPFIDQIIDSCVGSEFFSFMDGVIADFTTPDESHFVCPSPLPLQTP